MAITLTNIPKIMRANGWPMGAQLMESWFARTPAVAPAYSASVTNVIRMDWVLKFNDAKKVYDRLMREQIWATPQSQKKIISMLERKELLSGDTKVTFGDLSRPVEIVEADCVAYRDVYTSFPLDDLDAALGNFNFHVAVAGALEPTSRRVTITEVGVFVRDSFDFNEDADGDDDDLGYWNESDSSVSAWNPRSGERLTSADFRIWRDKHKRGGDFLVYSDVKRTVLPRPTSFTIPAHAERPLYFARRP